VNFIQSNAPPGSQKGQEILYRLLGTNVLENIAGLCQDRILYGPPRPDRTSSRHRFPAVPKFYKGEPPVGRRPGHHHFWPEIVTVVAGELDMVIGDYTYRAKHRDWAVIKPEIPHGECCARPHMHYGLVWFELDRPFPNMHVTEYRPGSGYESFGVLGLPQIPPFLRLSATSLVENECIRVGNPI
jgi:hypothetical protein